MKRGRSSHDKRVPPVAKLPVSLISLHCRTFSRVWGLHTRLQERCARWRLRTTQHVVGESCDESAVKFPRKYGIGCMFPTGAAVDVERFCWCAKNILSSTVSRWQENQRFYIKQRSRYWRWALGTSTATLPLNLAARTCSPASVGVSSLITRQQSWKKRTVEKTPHDKAVHFAHLMLISVKRL